ncbi:MAG: polyphosphate kinase 2 family protein [Acidobacteriota bacterium]|nr:polyphosphate kinase 2 family protein [Acidobacteriota bacterium]
MEHRQFIYKAGGRKRLENHDPDFTADFTGEQEAQEVVQKNAELLAKYQDMLMAHETKGLLIIFQAMDGAGKDATIKHVMSSLDPQGCELKMFKEPTEKELRHDYLWRATQSIPARGQIGIFNRSYYEQVITERVHPEKLKEQQLPAEAAGKDVWKKRFRHINNFEEYLLDNGIHVLKFFLHLSKEKQRQRLLERIERTEKKWKFSMDDIREREHWNDYLKFYEEAFKQTSTGTAPWYIIPDNHRWFARAVVGSIILEKLKSLHSKYPAVSEEERKNMAKAARTLEKDAAGRK